MIPFLAALLGGYVLLVLCGCAAQRKLLYFPTKLNAAEAGALARQEGFEPWENRAGEIIGWKIPAAGVATGSVLIVHGNAGCALNRGYLAQPLHEAGSLDVFVLEYPGYGARGGAANLQSWLAAGEEALAVLPADKPVYVVSESIGTGVAAHLAKTNPGKVSRMVMFVPYDSLASLAQSKMPLLLPYLFLRDRYEPAQWLKQYRGPVKIILAERDEIIPPKFGQRLFDSYPGPKSLELIAGAGHNEVAEQSPDWWRTALRLESGNPAGD